ncbi:MAG: flagellar hook-length control protein FliK [Rhodocyclaceae bacterium]|nr:flagellar hook-length control protein FliK [Rhodocyclaceae bacterium]
MPQLSPAPVSPTLAVQARPEADKDGAAAPDHQFANVFQRAGGKTAKPARDAGSDAGARNTEEHRETSAATPDSAAGGPDLLAQLAQQSGLPGAQIAAQQAACCLAAQSGAATGMAQQSAEHSAVEQSTVAPAPAGNIDIAGTGGLPAVLGRQSGIPPAEITAGNVAPAELAAAQAQTAAAGAKFADKSAELAARGSDALATGAGQTIVRAAPGNRPSEHALAAVPSEQSHGPAATPQAVEPELTAPRRATDAPRPERELTVQNSPAASSGSSGDASTVAPLPQQSAPTQPVREATPQVPVASSFGTRTWNEDVATQLTWMANRHQAQADLVLNPPHLGRIEVSLSLQGDVANAQFASPHPAVREALQQALPDLRAMLAESGITLGQAQVGAESFSRQPGEANAGTPRSRPRGAEQEAPLAQISTPARRASGLVDLYA